MKIIYILLNFMCFGINFCQAQNVWSNNTDTRPDSKSTRAIATDNLGNIYTVGIFKDTLDADPGPGVYNLIAVGYYHDVYLSKYDANGNFIWAKSFGGPRDEKVYSIVINAANEIYIGGFFQGIVDFDPGPGITSLIADGNSIYSDISDGFISKFNSDGDFLWVRSIGATTTTTASAETIRDLALDDAGNIYAIGRFGSFEIYTLDLDPGPAIVSLAPGTTPTNTFIIKLDENGNYINGVGVNVGSLKINPVAIVIRNAAVYICTNADDDNGGPSTPVSIVNKYDLNLNMLWSDTMGQQISITAMDIDDQGNILLGGNFEFTSDFDPGPAIYNLTVAPDHYAELFVCKLGNDGIFQWVKAFDQINDNSSIINLKINFQTGDCFIGGSVRGSGYFEGSNPYSYIAPVGSSAGYIEQMDASGNFKALYPFLATGTAGVAGPVTLFFDQSANLFIQGLLIGEADLDPSSQGTYLLNELAPDGGTFLSKWDLKEGINYYNTKANLGLENIATWSTTPDGTGPSPQNFSGGDHFHVINQANAALSGVLSISGIHSNLIIGDGIIPINLTVATGSAYIDHATSVDVLNSASLILQNNIVPALKQMADGSYVEFAQSGTSVLDSISIPVIRYYDLKLTGGLKNFGPDTTTIAHTFIADGVANLGGTRSESVYEHVSYLKCLGNLTFLNGTAFEPESAAAKERRFGLVMNGEGPVQTITSNGTEIMLISLVRTSDEVCNVVLSPGTNIFLGSAHGGGLSLKSGNATLSCTGGSVNFRDISNVSNPIDQGYINANATSLHIARDEGINNYFNQAYIEGTLKFTPSSIVKDLSISCAGDFSSSYADPLYIAGNITVTGELSLISDFIYMPGGTMYLTNTATLNPLYPGGYNSFISGTISKTGSTNFYFPVGDLREYGYGNYIRKFAPVELSNLSSSNTYTVFYKSKGYAVSTIDPVTLLANPSYGISGFEYWEITPTIPAGSADIHFYYKDANSYILTPSAVGIAHFDGTDWNDIGGIAGAANNINTGDVFVAGVSTFSPFTFGGTGNVVVPVKLTAFTATKQDKVVKLNWTTEQEINSKEFVIERSSDQNKWNQLLRINAAGNSSQKINYTATDFNPAKGINYYRLKEVDLDGKFTYSEIRSVYFGKDMNVVLAPNPAKDKISIYLPGNTALVSVNIYNSNDQLVKTISTAEESIPVNVGNLSKGIYTVKISGKHIYEVRKIVKM